jgi:hypothetical protein
MAKVEPSGLPPEGDEEASSVGLARAHAWQALPDSGEVVRELGRLLEVQANP